MFGHRGHETISTLAFITIRQYVQNVKINCREEDRNMTYNTQAKLKFL